MCDHHTPKCDVCKIYDRTAKQNMACVGVCVCDRTPLMARPVIHKIDSKNEWLLLSVTFTAKLELDFVLIFENAFSSFLFKSPLSVANVKTNRMTTTKWTNHKEWSFASNYFIFLENLSQF